MKRACAVLALLAASCTSPSSNQPAPATQERVTLLDPALGTAATQACSRPGPENPERFFTPSRREVTAIEGATMRALSDHSEEYAQSIGGEQAGMATPFDWPHAPSLYKRQYIGYYENGRRMIYGNFFPASEDFDARKPILICDGGWRLFGVEYDVGAMAVRRIAFDGSLGGPHLSPIEP